MAVAVQPNPSEPRAPKKPDQPPGLVTASIAGAVFVLAAAAVVLRLIPWAWEQGVGAAISGATNSLVSGALMITLQAAAAIGLLYVGSRLLSGRPVPGVRGGIFFMLAAAFVAFFVVRGLLAVATRGFTVGGILLMLVYVLVAYLVVQFFRTGRFTEWSVALDQGGWFDAKSYKRTQGLRVRRLTILGILLICGTGIWTLMAHNYLPQNATVKLPDGREVSNRMGDWVVGGTLLEPRPDLPREENRARPRVDGGVTLLPDLQFTIPLLLIAGSLWLAWRTVNYPQFADFLVATEAEINKVSWTTRRALFRDTLVVLTCLVLLTLFLFVVDVFWGAVLSSEWVNVLPTAAETEAHRSRGTAEPVKEW